MQNKKPFTREDLDHADVKILRDGRWGNALVSVAEVNGVRWTIKDFSTRSWFVRKSFAKFVLGRELLAVSRLKGIRGVPNKAFMVDEDMIAVEHLPGRPLHIVPTEQVTTEYLSACEEILHELHRRDLVHLDTRGTGNWVMMADGSPGLIDFQASLRTTRLPKIVRKFMEDMDMGGVYKKWAKYRPHEMGEFRQKENERIARIRRFWVLKGYFGMKKHAANHGKIKDD